MGLRDWYNKQKAEYRAQIAERNLYNVAAEVNSTRDGVEKLTGTEIQKLQQEALMQGKDAIVGYTEDNPDWEIDDKLNHDVAQIKLKELNERERFSEHLEPRVRAALDQKNSAYDAYQKVHPSDATLSSGKIIAGGGRGIGGFFGRLFSGRLTQSSRDKQAEAVKKSREKPLVYPSDYDERNALTRKISGYESESDADRKTRIDSRKEQYKAKKAREAQARAERNEKHESEKKARKEAKRRDIGVTGLRSNTGQPSPPFDSTPTTVKKNGGPSKK